MVDFLNMSPSSRSAHSATSNAGSTANNLENKESNNLELGELEQLTITNDNESSYDVR